MSLKGLKMKRIDNETKSFRKALIALTVVLAVPLGALLAQASFAGDAQAPSLIDKDFETCMQKFVSKRFYNRIDATDEQRQKLDSIMVGTADATRPQREAMRRNMLELSELMANDKATDEEITAKAHEIRAMHEKLMDERLASVLKARKVLTPAQRSKVQARLREVITGGGPVRVRRLSSLMMGQ